MPPGEEATDALQLPLGILGFEENKQYALLSKPEEAPFLWLQMLDEPNLSFLVISPFYVMPTYQPQLREEDVAFLGLQSPEDAIICNIVSLGKSGGSVNLKGPIVINRRTRRGKQVIPVNAANYETDHPLGAH